MIQKVAKLSNLGFNSKKSDIMHIDLNSCFATVEQQANPYLRGRPVAVAAYTAAYGCIVSPSVEAKRLGIKVGMRVKEGKQICPDLIVLAPDPSKYRYAHMQLRNLLSKYSDLVVPKSIDEFVLDFAESPVYKQDMFETARDIKAGIKETLGEWVTVSVGISTNRFLAKTASGLHKPDGLDEINEYNFLKIFAALKLTDLCGIAQKNEARLNKCGVYSVVDFYASDPMILKKAFHAITGFYWYIRLRGWEADDFESTRQSYNNSYAFPPKYRSAQDIGPVMIKLVEKVSYRMRTAGYKATGLHLGISYRDHNYWHRGLSFSRALFSPDEIYREMYKLLLQSPFTGKSDVRVLEVTCFGLVTSAAGEFGQHDLFEDVKRRTQLTEAMDLINTKWGNFVVGSGLVLKSKDMVKDRIAFGGVREMK